MITQTKNKTEVQQDLPRVEEKDFWRLFSPYRKLVVDTCTILLGNADDGEDAAQDIFLKLWEGRENITEVQFPKTYLVRVAKNYCIDLIRKRKENTDSIDDEECFAAQIADRKPHAENEAIQKEAVQILQNWLDKQKEPHKTVFTMAHFEDVSNKDIAQRLNLEETNVRVIISRMRKEVKEKLSFIRL